ncbi:MAG: tetratricopeptide repeat protein [Planctomycetia bacterium]|nr:tetratricopeptide repeat protein [Planctomycetia bacterium]
MSNSSRLSQLQSLLADEPNDPFLGYALAMEMESAGDTTGAIEQLQSLLLANPEYVPGFLQVGQLLIKADRLDEAKAMLTMGMQTAFKQADHHAYQEMEGILAGISA